MLIKKFKAHNLLQIAHSQTWKKQKKTKKRVLCLLSVKTAQHCQKHPLWNCVNVTIIEHSIKHLFTIALYAGPQ